MFILCPAAAQKLRGKVRIANVRYVEPFRNASSREYQDFLELFFRVVSWQSQSLFPFGMCGREGGRISVPVQQDLCL